MFRHRRMQLISLCGVLLTVLTLALVQATPSSVQTAHAATNQFHGVNWADPNDNFGTGNLVPVGLSTSDSYATTYAKATAILKGFQNLGANTVRMPFNAATVSGSWWGSYTAAWDAASALGMNVVVAPWLQNGTVSNTTSFYTMWDVVINKYSGNSHFYFDIMNEPWAMSASAITNLAATWLSRYSNVPRGRVMVPGLYSDIDLCSIGSDSRLNGTLLSIHMYTLGGETHPTEAGWVSSFEGRLCGYASRAVLTEFGVPMNTGVNYNGARDNNANDVSYLYALTDTVRNLGMGSIIWVGVKTASQSIGPGPCENASCAITTLNGSGTTLSLSINNQSGLDRLQYGWGGGGGSTPTPTPTHTPTATPTPTSPPVSGAKCSVHYVVTNQWSGGFGGSLTITNTGSSTMNGWSLQFSFANGQTITQGWNGTFTQSGGSVTIASVSYNGSLAPGASVNPGFNSSWNGTNTNPTAFTLNGQACSVV
jgi:Cellulose binding domain/Cellulase (glycosyl hydrolase family 5)